MRCAKAWQGAVPWNLIDLAAFESKQSLSRVSDGCQKKAEVLEQKLQRSFDEPRQRINGILVVLPNFGEETAAADTIKLPD
jgi:hypothetical protein